MKERFKRFLLLLRSA